MKTCDF